MSTVGHELAGATPSHAVLENCRVAPSPGSVAPCLFPLTYLDVMCVHFPPVKRLFLYGFPCSTPDFLDLHVRNLKISLSLALQRFFPLAGTLVPDGAVQSISYVEGSSVAFTVAESSDDLHDLVGNHPRDARRFRCLVPELPTCATKQPLLALQVTLFPGRGIGIGLTTHHAAADGFSSTHFMKTWASINRSLGDSSSDTAMVDPPSFDRSVVPEIQRLPAKLFNNNSEKASRDGGRFREIQRDTSARDDMVRATFLLTTSKLESLRRWLLTKSSVTCSDFVVASALVWVCAVKARGLAATDQEAAADGFAFLADRRGRPGGTVPTNYFGNCLDPCIAEVKRSELVGEDGMAKAAKAIWDKIQELKSASGPMQNDLIPVAQRISTFQPVAGSPRLEVYKVDFGWGKPTKVEVVNIDLNCSISLAENESGGGGIEVGMALPMEEMDKFDALFHELILKHC